MPTRKKVKGKTKPKRKKPQVAKATTRRKTAATSKKPAKKAQIRRSSPKKATPTANAAAKPRPAGPPARPVAG